MTILFLALLAAPVACPNPHRSQTVVEQFKAANPCPKTCATYVREGRAFKLYQKCGRCQVDHICALACCGPDAVENLQWLTSEENRAKSADCSACSAKKAEALRKLQADMDEAIAAAARKTNGVPK